MRLVHEPADGDARTLAEDAEVADSFLSRARGLMFRREFPPALAFCFDDVGRRSLHMAFVFAPIDAVWVADGTVVQVKRLSPWTGTGLAAADLVVELPAGGAAAVEEGDSIRLVEGTDNL
ncbi:MAG: DUF192 domain-containing protein [Halobacteriaceae archaeon]